MVRCWYLVRLTKVLWAAGLHCFIISWLHLIVSSFHGCISLFHHFTAASHCFIISRLHLIVSSFHGCISLFHHYMAASHCFINSRLDLFLQCFIIDSEVLRKQIQKLGASFSRKHRYAEIEEEIVSTPSWPPISQSTLNLAQLMRMESVANGNPDVSAGGDNPLTAKHTAAHDSKSVQALNDKQGQSQGHTAPSDIQLNLPSSPGVDLPSMPLITNTASDQSVSRSMSYDTCPLVENEVAPSVPPVLTTVL